MKKIITLILRKISRVIFWITPKEFLNSSDLEKKIKDNLVDETFNNFKEAFSRSALFTTRKATREFAIKTSLLNDQNKDYYYLEFGVFKGGSANFFSKYVNKLYVFDNFQGYKEDRANTHDVLDSRESFNLNNKIPKLNPNVEPIIGWVEDTLVNFLETHKPKINFVHLDINVYSSSKFVLEKIKPYLVKNSIIIFDQLYNYVGWQHGEYRSLKEVFKDSEFDYRAFQITSRKCVIQIK